MGKKKTTLLKPILFFGVVLMTLILVVVSFTYSWFTSNEEVVYPFEISADGVLYVYVDADVQENPTSLIPAVAMEGAVAEGLPMNVLKTHAEDNNSYIKSAASITDVTGRFTVFNDGVGYDKIELPKDAEGNTLYPKIDGFGNIAWKSDNHTPGNWETYRVIVGQEAYIRYKTPRAGDYYLYPAIDPYGKIKWKSDDYTIGNWETHAVYDARQEVYGILPLIDENGDIVWREDFSFPETSGSTEWNYYGEDYWETSYLWTEDEVPENVEEYTKILYSTETDYSPLIDSEGKIIWREDFEFPETDGSSEWAFYGEDFWECEMVETPGAAEAEVSYNIFFKASDDPEAQDYFDPDLFTIKRIYFTSTPDAVAEADMATASTVFQVTPTTADLKQGKFTIKGTQPLFVHAEIYLTYPDELLGDSLRGKPIYMALGVSVSLQVEIPDYMVE